MQAAWAQAIEVTKIWQAFLSSAVLNAEKRHMKCEIVSKLIVDRLRRLFPSSFTKSKKSAAVWV